MVSQPFKIVQNTEKKMPCNIEAEQAVIGSILVSNEIYDEVSSVVDAQKFFDPIHVKIFETIENTNKSKIKPSQIDMFQEIKKIGSYKAKINLHAEVQAIIHIEGVKEEDKHKS